MNRTDRRRQKKIAHKKVPGSAGILHKAAKDFHAGKYEAAGKKCAWILKSQPENADANNLRGLCAYKMRDFETAECHIIKAIDCAPGQADMLSNLGHVLKDVGRNEEALKAFNKSLSLSSSQSSTYQVIAEVLLTLDRADEALDSFQNALSLDPENIAILTSYGNALIKQKQFDQSINCLRQVIETKPDFAGGYVNLGNALKEQGEFAAAIELYNLAIDLAPELPEALFNVAFTQALLGDQKGALATLSNLLKIAPAMEQAWFELTSNIKIHLFQDGNTDIASVLAALPGWIINNPDMVTNLALLELSLAMDHGAQAAQAPFDKAMTTLAPLHDQSLLKKKPIVALLHFGRSGSGLIHSLIDNHPQVSTLPSIYTKGYFEEGVWEQLVANGQNHLPESFVKLFAPMFDAANPSPVPGVMGEDTSMLGIKEGLTTVGKNHDEKLCVDRDAFCTEAHKLMSSTDTLDAGNFLRIAFQAFDVASGNKKKDPLIFYHIHNPGLYARVNFLQQVPNARLMMMVREPLQSCESWIREDFKQANYGLVSQKIATMMYDIDRPEFARSDCIGLKLEDLKEKPEKTLQNLCRWLQIDEAPSLYEMTVQGKMWWGDPTSADFVRDKPMPPFDNASVIRPLGSIFSERDQLVLSTLYYPFRVRFAYAEKDVEGFKQNLKTIRLMLEDFFDFEKDLMQLSGQAPETFKQRQDYIVLRARLTYRWNLLDQKGTYLGMLKALSGVTISSTILST